MFLQRVQSEKGAKHTAVFNSCEQKEKPAKEIKQEPSGRLEQNQQNVLSRSQAKRVSEEEGGHK